MPDLLPAQPFALTSPEQAAVLASWLAGPRARALRRAAIGLRDSVLEIGAGHCVTTAELQRRARGSLIALDLSEQALADALPDGVSGVCADCLHLPFADRTFDLVFFQSTLMWIPHLADAVHEAARVLFSGGALVALEPDYGGMMEYPPLGLRDLWTDALTRAGADPLTGRKLPTLCEAAGLDVWVELVHLPQTADAGATSLFEGLPLTADEAHRTNEIATTIQAAATRWGLFIHLPYFLIVATKPQTA
jgi:SAM-dependent methyltransferase